MPINALDGPKPQELVARDMPGSAGRTRRATSGAVDRPVAVSSRPGGAPEQHRSADKQAQQTQLENTKQPPPSAAMNLKFSTDEDTGKAVVSLVDPTSGEVLRQMPTEEAIEVAKAIGRYQGMFVNLKV